MTGLITIDTTQLVWGIALILAALIGILVGTWGEPDDPWPTHDTDDEKAKR